MKKSLSLLLAIAMVFGLFASVVSAADNELTTQQKFDALKAKGIFAGMADGSAGLDQEMTRAQAARIIALLKGLEGIGETDTRVVTEKPFPDVDLGKWYTEEVDAVKADGSFKGNADGTFNPNGQLTVQELAVAVAAALGFDATKAEPVEIEGAATWAGSSIKFLQDAGYAVPTNYTANALRGQLVDATFVADAVLNPVVPANAGIVSAKATGAKTVTVNLDAPVDGSKAKLELKRNGTAQVVTTAWSEDKKVATLTLDTKIIEATYTVELSGIDNLNEEKKSFEFKAENEKVASIEILTASETLPLADGVKIEFKAANQYGEKSTLNAGSFIIAAGAFTPAPVAGEQAFTLNLKTGAPVAVKGDKVPVTIIHSASGNQVNKVFTVGEEPIVSKVEVGDLKDSANKTIESIKAGSTAYIEFKAYDQYGIQVTDAATLNNAGKGVTVIIPDGDIVKGTNVAGTDPAFVGNTIGDSADDLQISAKAGASAKKVTISLYANGTGQSVQKVVEITTPKVPASVEFVPFTGTIAKGDTNIKIGLKVKDAAGAELSATEIADAATNNKFTVYAIGGVVDLAAAPIVLSGADKGKVLIASASNKGSGSIVVQLRDKPDAKDTINLAVVDSRIPERVSVSTPAAGKLLNGASSAAKFKIFDQYGGDSKTAPHTDYYVIYELSNVSGSNAALTDVTIPGGTLSFATVTTSTYVTLANAFDKAVTFNAAASGTGTFKVTATLYKENGVTDIAVHSASNQIEVIDGSATTLTYAVTVDGAPEGVLHASADALFDRTLKVTAKDSNGTDVALPTGIVASVTPSNDKITVTGADKVRGVVGKSGESNLNVLFKTHNGYSTATVAVTVKGDVPNVTELKVANSSKNIASSALNGKLAWDAALMGNLTAKDQYGTSYVNDSSTPKTDATDAFPGTKFFISNIKHSGTTTNSAVSVNDATGVITYADGGANDIASFVLNAISPSGKTVSTEITVD